MAVATGSWQCRDTMGGIIHIVFRCILNDRQIKGTAANHHSAVAGPLLVRLLGGGGTYAKPLRTMLKRGITYTGRVDLGFSLVDVDLEGKARQPPW